MADPQDDKNFDEAVKEPEATGDIGTGSVSPAQLALMHDLSVLVSSTRDTRIVLKRALRGAVRLTGAEAGAVLLKDENTGELVFADEVGPAGVVGMRLKPGEGIAGVVVERGSPEIVEHTENDERHSRKVARYTRYPTRNLLCVPLRDKRNILGAVQVINKKQGGFTSDDVYLLQALAGTVAVSLQYSKLYSGLELMVQQSIEALIDTIDLRDRYTGAHTRRVTYYCSIFAGKLGIPRDELQDLYMAAVLHDIGKLGVADAILGKTSKLTPEEYEQMKTHCVHGERILGHIERFSRALPGVRSHHEAYDGTGYPDGLKGSAIPLIARIISVADTFDAMTTTRPYRKGMKPEEAIRQIKALASNQLDPRVVDAFTSSYSEGHIEVHSGDVWVPEAMAALTAIPPLPADIDT